MTTATMTKRASATETIGGIRSKARERYIATVRAVAGGTSLPDDLLTMLAAASKTAEAFDRDVMIYGQRATAAKSLAEAAHMHDQAAALSAEHSEKSQAAEAAEAELRRKFEADLRAIRDPLWEIDNRASLLRHKAAQLTDRSRSDLLQTARPELKTEIDALENKIRNERNRLTEGMVFQPTVAEQIAAHQARIDQLRATQLDPESFFD